MDHEAQPQFMGDDRAESSEMVQPVRVTEYGRVRAATAESALILIIIGATIAAGILILGPEIWSARFSTVDWTGLRLTGF